MRSLILIPAIAAAACSDSFIEPLPGEPVAALQAVEIADGLVHPLHLTAPSGDNRLFVVEQEGRIRIMEDGALLAEPFLDLSQSVNFIDEGGLLGLAFDPDYATTGRFWVHYTDAADGGAVVVERYEVSDDPNIAEAASAAEVLRIDKPTLSHNGGQLEFGPDGMLYISIGDGGEYEDPQGHAQNPGTLLGTILRIDVRTADPYVIPQDNPFSSGGGRPEVWAYGLRNPWRFAIDADDGLMIVTDVGQHEWEEINAVPAGAAPVNYGWNVMEASHCFNAETCDADGLTEPVFEYSHSEGCSIIGGYVYRGERLTGLQGNYFFGDYCQGWVNSVRVVNGAATDRRDWQLGFIGHILGFGRDAAGELYVLTTTGSVFRLDPK
jgi:hypothetical protein